MASPSSKRLIVCCDGSWMNALGKQGESSPPSNVWRICRLFKNVCDDGTNQVVYYHAGVGSSGSKLDSITGGDFGVGLDMDICQLYTFISMNYVDGDAIILVGFSRGAFTVRAVADMIASLGLMTHSGLDRFYEIFTDYQLMGSKDRQVDEFLCKDVLQPYAGEKGTDKILWEEERKRVYREFLKEHGYTRDRYQDGVTKIKIKAVAVWDTVGDLGIPPVPMLGVRGSVEQEVENAFHALALDEPRAAFRPTLWERVHDNETNLKQVWFPGTHANVGGGYYDQQMADITLAWMCDQLVSVAVEFNLAAMRALFESTRAWSAIHPFPWVPCPSHSSSSVSASASASESHSHSPFHISLPPIFHHFSFSDKSTQEAQASCSCDSSSSSSSQPLPWANADIFPATLLASTPRDTKDSPLQTPSLQNLSTAQDTWAAARPYALGQLRAPTSTLQHALGTITRRPGGFNRVDEDTNVAVPGQPLRNTGEAVHASVRVRLACGGLGLDDAGVWKCAALTTEDGKEEKGEEEVEEEGEKEWKLVQGDDGEEDGADREKSWACKHTWRWEKAQATPAEEEEEVETGAVRVLPEEPLVGVCERMLLEVTKGEVVDVWAYADEHAVALTATPGEAE